MRLSPQGLRMHALLAAAGALVSATPRTERALRASDRDGDHGRSNVARAFLNRARKSDAKRRVEKAARKANRRRR